ncbi:MAG TPA: hemerythrin domain-containing protein [Polyangia bacterium]
MQRIIDNLTRQHRELVRTATEMFGWLDAAKLRARGGGEVHRALSSLSGILKVHLAMEDRSLYPHLVNHRDAQLRTLALRFLDERVELREQYDEYKARWLSTAAIEAGAERFIDETRAILGMLWNRMRMEDEILHPEIVRVFAAA